jgi:hypothetical protein
MAMNEKQVSDLDQAFAMLGETWPPALFRFFKNCIMEGFTEDQALVLTVTFLREVCKGRE